MMDGMPESVSAAYSMARDELLVLRVLRQIDRRAHAEGQDNEQGSEQDLHGVADIRQNADARR